jgi:putative DNA methylase
MLRENLYHHAGTKYELLAWCIMSNHMHVVLQPLECVPRRSDPSGATDTEGFCDELADGLSPLVSVMHSLKSYTANRANALLGRSGRFWQAESYDHWIRDLDELERIVAYVAHNPVRAGLCRRPQEWQYSSAYDRFVRDGSDCALVGWLRETWRGD